MLNKQVLLRWSTGLLSAGGALFLAACYGAQRPPHGPPQESRSVGGVVMSDSGPVSGIAVCDTRLPDQCPLTDADGRFVIRYLEDGNPTKLCTRNAVEGAAVRYTEACVEVPPGAASVQITVQPLE